MAVRLQGRDVSLRTPPFQDYGEALIMKLQHSEGLPPTSKEQVVGEKQSMLSHKHLLPECSCNSCHKPWGKHDAWRPRTRKVQIHTVRFSWNCPLSLRLAEANV